MTPRCYDIAEFMMCPIRGSWPWDWPKFGVSLPELSLHLLDNIKDPQSSWMM